MKKIRNYSAITAHGDVPARKMVLDLMDRVLHEVDSYQRIRDVMHVEGNVLHVGVKSWNLESKRNIYLLGAGKACNAMAQAVCDVLGERITKGIICVKIKEEQDHYCNTDVYVGGHPLPNEEGMLAAQKMIDLILQAKPEDLFISVCSGGSSALLTYPIEGITLEDEIKTQDMLLRSGAKILEINAVRRHISRTNGGRLAELICHKIGAELISFQISDAVGKKESKDRALPAEFHGTPFGGDQTTIQNAREMIINYDLRETLPQSVVSYLFDDSRAQETPGDIAPDKMTTFLMGNLADSCTAAKHAAQEMGVPCMVLTTFLEGESSEAGLFLTSLAREIKYNERPIAAPCFVVCAGETTCSVDKARGVGGPSQELTLGASIGLRGMNGVAIASIDTEGTDGPTIYAGGIVDGTTFDAVEQSGENVYEALRYHYSGNVLERVQDSIFTGNTGTNLCDFNVLYVG